MLFAFVGSGILGIAYNIINVFAEAGQASLTSNLFVFATLIPSLALGSRRLHDIGKSGWWQLAIISLMALGFILIIVGIVVAFISGSDGDLGLVVWLILVGSGLCALVVTFVWGIRCLSGRARMALMSTALTRVSLTHNRLIHINSIQKLSRGSSTTVALPTVLP